MPRWEGNAQERLAKAAMELFQERGYASTLVEDIAAHAGLTERTFFRYFKDKREVLFSGADWLQKTLLDAITAAPKSRSPLDAIMTSIEALVPLWEGRRDYVEARQALLVAHPELMEREVMKLSAMTEAIAAALRGRKIAELPASMCATAGIAILNVGFARWLADPKKRGLQHHFRSAREALGDVVAR